MRTTHFLEDVCSAGGDEFLIRLQTRQIRGGVPVAPTTTQPSQQAQGSAPSACIGVVACKHRGAEAEAPQENSHLGSPKAGRAQGQPHGEPHTLPPLPSARAEVMIPY